jgi:hypothetical protein
MKKCRLRILSGLLALAAGTGLAELNPYFSDRVPITDEEFLKYNDREQAKVVVRGNAKQKDWLRIYLDTCDDSPRKQSLLRSLEGEQP